MRNISIALAGLGLIAITPAIAADPDAPAYDNGSVWDVTSVRTKDGRTDDYLRWLAGPWKQQEEALKKAGTILSYKVLLATDARAGEPDVFLVQEYPNMAVFDKSTESQYALRKSIEGSLTQSNEQQVARGDIRTIMGDVLMRQAILK